MSKLPVILLDCDGILCDFLTSAVEAMNQVTGESKTVKDFDSWHIFAGLSKKDLERVFWYMSEKGFCRGLEPYPGAKTRLKQLRKRSDLYIVTQPFTPSRHWMFERTAWLEEHFGVPHDRVVHTSAKHRVSGDVFIDDKAENVRNWAKHQKHGHGLLWDTQTNQTARGLKRVKGWKDLFMALDEIAVW